MKFGHNLARNQVPEWSSSYINYKGLKKLVKVAADAARNGEDPDLAGKWNVTRMPLTRLDYSSITAIIQTLLTFH
jgi:hypothetical protein